MDVSAAWKMVESLIAKAESAKTAADALHYSQAACNAANAIAASITAKNVA